MKLFNFKITEKKGNPLKETIYAEVDIETGILWWKKKERKRIFKKPLSLFWRFEDTGRYTPRSQAENLATAYEATELRIT